MEAILSSQRAVGLLLDHGEVLAVITPEHIEARRASTDMAAVWLREAPDAVFLEDVSAENAQQRLRGMVKFEEAFRLFLPLFDSTLSRSLRIKVAGELDRSLTEHGLFLGRLRARFYAEPFPQPARLDEALGLSRLAGTNALRGFLFGLKRRQRLIRDIAIAWNQIPAHFLPKSMAREEVARVFVKQGVFARLSEALDVRASLREFIWAEEERWEAEPHFIALVEQLTLPFFEKRQREHIPLDQFEKLLSTLEHRKSEILGFLRLGEIARAQEEGEKLADFDSTLTGTQSAAILLCELSAKSKELDVVEAHFSFAQLAVQYDPLNIRCWTQLADAYKSAAEPEKALEIYEDILCEDSTDIVVETGRAEVLHALGRSDEALEAYQVAAKKRPEDRVVRNGLANLLARAGRFSEALKLLPDAEPHTEHDFFDHHTRGMIFLQMGEINTARLIFEVGLRSVTSRKQNTYYRNAFAFCCLWSNRPGDALEALNSPTDARVIPAQEVMRSHALGALGRMEECCTALAPLKILHSPIVCTVAMEIDARFIQNQPKHSEQWLLKQEEELLLAA